MNKYIVFLLIGILCACNHTPTEIPEALTQPLVFPDYEGVTIPPNIAPLSFRINTEEKEVRTVLHTPGYSVTVKNKEISISARKWKKLLLSGEKIQVDISARKGKEWVTFHSFPIYVSKDEIDPYITYRLIAPGYEVWNKMGIYQRCLSSYEESPIYENNTMSQFCVNCHTTNQGNPEQFIFHQRPVGGTLLSKDGIIKRLNTHYNEKIQSLVYPAWHPSGNYIAFSVNKTVQSIHSTDPNRIEVWDFWSDIVILDVNTNRLLTIPSLMSEDAFETFPSFSPDGKRLYFCSAPAVTLPDSVKGVKYNLCSMQIDMDKKAFGKVDTLVYASANNFSTSFPRVSPDGRFLLYTQHEYGNFSIWHREADLKMYDLEKKEPVDISVLNSNESESYHTWSSNGRWVVFSSRRGDGLYTRPYIAHISSDGTAAKPFLLPQKNSTYYIYHDRSYNIPEFMTGKIKGKTVEIEKLVEGRK